MKMLIAGDWTSGSGSMPVRNPFDHTEVGTVPRASAGDIERAVAYAAQGARVMRKIPGYDRYQFLMKAAALMREQADDLAETITLEEGKILAEAKGEVQRAAETMIGSAEEAKRLGSEVVPLDGAEGVGNRLGFTLRVPCGVVLAITPFNFPLSLVARKVGPKLAARLRANGVGAILSSGSRGLRGQMRQANALRIPYTAILGDDEIEQGVVMIRDMQASTQETKPMQEFLDSAGA